MRLVGSKLEQDFRKELIESHVALFQSIEEKNFLNLLKINFKEMKTAYVINWTPEQGEDLYTLLINLDIIVKIEISRINQNENPIIEVFRLQEFQKGLSKLFQIKLAVAMDLAKKDIEDTLN